MAVGCPAGEIALPSILSHLVLASVLMHSMLGCCIHHNHPEAGEASGSLTALTQDSPTARSAEQCPSRDEPADHHDRSCHAGICVFVRQAAGDASLRLRDLLAIPRCEPAVQVILLTPTDDQSTPLATVFPAHVPLHLAKRLLLI